MSQLYSHGRISCNNQYESCIICPYSEIWFDEIYESYGYSYTDEIFCDDSDVVLGMYDAAVYFLFLCNLIIQAIRFHFFKYMERCFGKVT